MKFELVSQGKESPFVVRPITKGKMWEASPWRVRGRSAKWTVLRRVVWCLEDTEVGSAKTDSRLGEKKKKFYQ